MDGGMTMNVQDIAPKSFSEYAFSPEVEAPPINNKHELDIIIEKLRKGAGTFAGLSLDERIELARSMQQGYLKIAERSVDAACKAKGIMRGTPLEGEEWATGPWAVVRHLRLVREQLSAIRKSGNTSIGKIATTVDGRLSVRVFPSSAMDALLFKGVRVDVHLQGGMARETLDSFRAKFYKYAKHDGRVVLVLGAGNLAMIPVMDVLTKMFNKGKACLLKMNPVNAYLGPFIEEAFAVAIDRGFLSVVYGGAEEGKYLVRHAGIDEVHITGSDKTFDNIVWGPSGPERNARLERGAPLVSKRITSELGNVSPIIIAPGPYTDRELRYMAEDIAGYLVMNASFLCCAAKMLVVPKGWEKRRQFLDMIADVLKGVPPRKAYYPGAGERYKAFTRGRLNVRRIGAVTEGTLPWTIVGDLDPRDKQEPLFMAESFCPVLGETAVGSSDPVDFLNKAAEFANNRLWGTLSATLVVHPKSMKSDKMSEAVEQAIVRLRYGTVCVNAFPGMSFVFGSPPWGAYPGSTDDDIQSGQGWVHNTAMLEGIEKVVARFPFMSFPKPAYFPSHRTVHTMMRRMTELEENGRWMKVPGVVFAAMRG
jgi:acyl-CoA reductase-like NAD-dependent aldehyde dehydrogenase